MEIICSPLSNGVVFVSFLGTFRHGKPSEELSACLHEQFGHGRRKFVLWIRGRIGRRPPLKSILNGFEARRCFIHVVATDEPIRVRLSQEKINAYDNLAAAFNDLI